ncbi:MAG TPA: T9SS type A sorting domain-containing protein [Chitinophagaceae bacterium]|nr:T9SS type A sorting domain-containing protein [Chitinophagaceae bacterium]
MVRRSLLSITMLALVVAATAQNTSRKAFAITGGQKGQSNWTEVRLIDLSTGAELQTIYSSSQVPQVFHARTGKPIAITNDNNVRNNSNMPFSTFSAACAYDSKHDRLYYTPMGINQLRYIDMGGKSPRIYYFEGEAFGQTANLQDEANHITRMVIGADGNGYALSNDGNHLLRFTTGRKPIISDLGNLVDDQANGGVSIHNRCSSWGGDMIADAFGKLHLISARQAVFEINIDSRVATFKGYISGLPANYTTNGAVVDDEGKVIVGSAVSTQGYYSVDLQSLKATKLESKEKVFNTSDLANANLALKKEADQKASAVSAAALLNRQIVRNDNISVYPNPVTDGTFRLYFDNQRQGKYEIQLLDLTGRVVSSQSITIGAKAQVEDMVVSSNLARGMYLVKVVDGRRKAMFSDKILIQ